MAVYTIDASVFLNALNSAEVGHAESRAFFAHVRAERTPMIEPALLLPEVAAAVARGRNDAGLARAFAAALTRLPELVLVPVDRVLALEASDTAAERRLRGSDAVYAAVAQRFGSILVTQDREQLDRLARVLTVRTPGELSI